jgi:hypothetical protein
VQKIKTLKNGQGPTKGCRAIVIRIFFGPEDGDMFL